MVIISLLCRTELGTPDANCHQDKGGWNINPQDRGFCIYCHLTVTFGDPILRSRIPHVLASAGGLLAWMCSGVMEGGCGGMASPK
jgi:hypothetical protein